MKTATLAIFSLMTGAALATAAPLIFQSSEHQTALLELYTSEGCSSCPRAEARLTKLKEAPGLWKDFVPVAFHVDYWDYLGWRDKWSAKQFTARQRAYTQSWRSGSFYTPCYVLDGAEWRDWAAPKGPPPQASTKPGVLTVRSEDTKRWQATFSRALPGQGKFEINAALLLSGVSSEVTNGENQGRQLEHDFVVLALTKEPLSSVAGRFQGEFTLTAGKHPGEGRLGVAVWITNRNGLAPLQATGGWINDAPAKPSQAL